MGKRGAWLTGAGVMAVVVAARSFFVVDESELALVVSFGSVVRSVSAAGLHGKRPWHSVQRFDGRMQLLELEPRETLTRDPKNIVVAPYACWRVDPAQLETFVRAVPGGDPTTAGRRLGERIWDVLMAELSALRLTQIVNENPESLEQSQMLRRVLVTCRAKASDLGIELRDVQLKRITRPEGTKQAVYREMIAERAKEANYIRR